MGSQEPLTPQRKGADEMELIAGFVQLLGEFSCVFNAQSFPIFVELMTG